VNLYILLSITGSHNEKNLKFFLDKVVTI